nr:MAG TPA: hypothetical protein [Crassvirales sp.]
MTGFIAPPSTTDSTTHLLNAYHGRTFITPRWNILGLA